MRAPARCADAGPAARRPFAGAGRGARREEASSEPAARRPRRAAAPVQTIRPPAFDPQARDPQSPIAPARVVDLGSARGRRAAPPLPEVPRRLRPCVAVLPLLRRLARGRSVDLRSLRARPAAAAAGRSRLRARVDGGVERLRAADAGAAGAHASLADSGAIDRRHGLARVAGPPARARLVLIARDGGEGPGYPLGELTDIGRTEGNILLGDDRYVSPRHARIQARGGAYYLRDLASTNGVYLRIPFGREAPAASKRRAESNRPASLEQPVSDQDLFLVGQQVLKFEVVKHAEEGFGVASENGTLVFGTPAAPRYARLSQRTVEGVVRDVYHLQKAETIIGREVGDLVFTEDPFLSRRHAAVVVQGAALARRASSAAFR